MGVTAAIGMMAGSAYNANRQRKDMKKANAAAQAAALRQEKQMEQQMNAANKKRPDTNSMLANASQSARAGQSGTMLTGPTGIDPNALTLGKTTLLGGG